MSSSARIIACIEALEERRLFSEAASLDLAVQAVSAPSSTIAISGHHVQAGEASVKIVNLGPAVATGKLAVSFYFSADRILDNHDILAGTIRCRSVSIRPSHTRVLSALLNPPANISAGHYFLFAVISPSVGITDTNSLNNVGITRARVSVLRRHGSNSNTQTETLVDICYSGPSIDCFDTGQTATESPAPDDGTAETESTEPVPGTQPAETQPEPTTQPTDTQPATQPVDTGPPDGSDGEEAAPPADSSNDSDWTDDF